MLRGISLGLSAEGDKFWERDFSLFAPFFRCVRLLEGGGRVYI